MDSSNPNQKKGPGVDENSAPSQKAPENSPFFKIHQQACRNKQVSYIDPETGYHVLTSYFLKERGYCCTNRCRHCPYGFHEDAVPYFEDEK